MRDEIWEASIICFPASQQQDKLSEKHACYVLSVEVGTPEKRN